VLLAGQTRALDSVDDTAEDDSASTLDVIVEAGVQITVTLKSGEGVLEILKLDDNTRSFVRLETTRDACEGESLTRASAQ
jgi:hypothetical protein